MGLEHWVEQVLPRFLGAPQLSPPDLDCTFPLNSGTSLPVTYGVQNTPPAWLLHPVVGLNHGKSGNQDLLRKKNQAPELIWEENTTCKSKKCPNG